MNHSTEKLLADFHAGKISRRQLLQALGDPLVEVLTAAADRFVNETSEVGWENLPKPKEICEFLGVADRLDPPVGALPYGVAKRVDVARALAVEPQERREHQGGWAVDHGNNLVRAATMSFSFGFTSGFTIT